MGSSITSWRIITSARIGWITRAFSMLRLVSLMPLWNKYSPGPPTEGDDIEIVDRREDAAGLETEDIPR